ncbi:MAG: 2-oxoacid:acceptor oxidoreductase family protein [Candidatus Bathyarchaeia archaeon]
MKRLERVKMEHRIIISGAGGQGVISAGEILSEALFKAGYEVVNTRSYGAEARGGSARSEVIVSEEEINDLEIREANILVLMSSPAYRVLIEKAKKHALVFVEKQILADLSDKGFRDDVHLFEVSANETAVSLGNPIVANMVFLGVLIKKTGLLTLEKLEETVRSLIPPSALDINIRAVKAGYSIL